MMNFDLKKLLRKNIAELVPYSSARDEYTGTGAVLLDANESPYNSPLNRYPDPLQKELKRKLAAKMKINPSQLFLGNGSDEAIDLIMRAFCIPGKEEIITIDPSYGMYEVSARINDIDVKKVLLNDDFSLNVNRVKEAVTDSTKIIFLCSPNNPTANLLDIQKMTELAEGFEGIVVVDEAYIDFSGSLGMIPYMGELKNLVILRTLSKAWGLAGIRLGMAIADKEIIDVLSRIKYPYNVNVLTQQKALEMLEKDEEKQEWIGTIIAERKKLETELQQFNFVKKIYPSDANFILLKVIEPLIIYNFLKTNNLIVRNRSNVSLCEGCLRITVGNPDENKMLLKLLGEYGKKK